MRLLPPTRPRDTPSACCSCFSSHLLVELPRVFIVVPCAVVPFHWCRCSTVASRGRLGARSHAWPWVEIPRLGRQQRPISPTNTDPEERAAQSALGLMPKGLRDCGRIGFAGQCAGLAARLNRNRVIGSFLGPVTRSNRLSQGQLFQRSHLAGWLFTFYGYPTTRQRSRSSEKARSSSKLYRWRHRLLATGHKKAPFGAPGVKVYWALRL